MVSLNDGLQRLRVTSRRLWLCSIAMIIIGSTFPWTAIQPHPVWDHVQWIPFTVVTSLRRLALDIVINVGMYMPFGYLGVSILSSQSRLTRIVFVTIMALILSMGIEVYQFFNPYRYPTVTDIIMNVSGAIVGAGTAFIGRHSLPKAVRRQTSQTS